MLFRVSVGRSDPTAMGWLRAWTCGVGDTRLLLFDPVTASVRVGTMPWMTRIGENIEAIVEVFDVRVLL